jgi:Golgi phosphoprotein 3 (GPP34)
VGLASVRAVLLAEDLLLLLTDDTSGKLPTGAVRASLSTFFVGGRLSISADEVEVLLAGANLVELALMGRVAISREVKPIPFLYSTSWGNRKVDRLIVRDPSPTGDAVLDAAVQIAIRSEGKLWSVLRQPSKKLQRTLCERLVDSGMIRHEQRTILAVISVDRWPAQDSRHKVEVRRRVIQALVEQTTPDTRIAALIALLHTIRQEFRIVDPRGCGMSRSQLIWRGDEIAKSNWAPEAVRDSIDTIIAATGKEVESVGEPKGGGGGV